MITSRSSKMKKLFNDFKENCEIVTLESKTTNNKIKVIKHKGKTYITGSVQEAFSMAIAANDLKIQ